MSIVTVKTKLTSQIHNKRSQLGFDDVLKGKVGNESHFDCPKSNGVKCSIL